MLCRLGLWRDARDECQKKTPSPPPVNGPAYHMLLPTYLYEGSVLRKAPHNTFVSTSSFAYTLFHPMVKASRSGCSGVCKDAAATTPRFTSAERMPSRRVLKLIERVLGGHRLRCRRKRQAPRTDAGLAAPRACHPRRVIDFSAAYESPSNKTGTRRPDKSFSRRRRMTWHSRAAMETLLAF